MSARPRATHRRVSRFRTTPAQPGTSLISTNRWAWSALRKTILIRDMWRCAVCGGAADSVDHRVPRALGGSDDPANLRAVCTRDQNPDARPIVVPFPTPAATRPDHAAAVAAKIRPIIGELTIAKPSRR